jgi:hypothetical protein
MSLTDSLRSATYNPEAEAAMSAEREKANKVRDEIIKGLDNTEIIFTTLASKPYTPKWTIQQVEKTIKDARVWLEKNPAASEQVYRSKLVEIQKQGGQILETNTYLYGLMAFERIMNYMITQWLEAKKMLTKADREKYKEFYEELRTFNKKNQSNPKLVDFKVFWNQFNRKVETFSKQKGIWDSTQVLVQTALTNPEKFEQDIASLEQQVEETKKLEDEKFSFQRFTKKVTATATSIITGLFYTMFCLVIGMLAANQAIGREPAYRILYFIYGFIFAPFLAIYYLYLWFNGKAPKIYTLLPLTQTVAETTIGKFLLFPFAYKEDKPARDLMVEFLTQSAEMVGSSFDPTSLGSIGKQVETVAENLKNLTAETAQAVGEAAGNAAQAAAKAAESLPSLNSLRVNALKPTPPS